MLPLATFENCATGEGSGSPHGVRGHSGGVEKQQAVRARLQRVTLVCVHDDVRVSHFMTVLTAVHRRRLYEQTY